MTTLHLGFEVDTGEPVEIPLKHLAVTGQTQESGKTTTLEALVYRAGVPAIAFVTKRGEASFAGGNRLAPYFRDRADWQFVTSIIDATLQEKNKFLRPWIMKICRTTRTLAEVHQEVRKALVKAKGINEGVYTQLDAYLELIVPEIGRTPLAAGVSLRPGLNVMDVSGYQAAMQMLFVRSAIDWVNEREHGVVTVVPEAWEFVPEGKNSPVKAGAVELVRKGAGIGNFIWVDSQDMAGVDKVILRGCTVWLIGVQREANEIRRNLANIPANIKRPKPGQIAELERGQFYACWKDRTVKVYVQPAWMPADEARRIALGELSVDRVKRPTAAERSNAVTSEQAEALRAENQQLKQRIRALEETLDGLRSSNSKPAAVPPADPRDPPYPNGHPASDTGDLEKLYQAIKRRLIQELPKDPEVIRIVLSQPDLQVRVERKVLEIKGDTPQGRFAQLIAEGFFDQPMPANAAFMELRRRGASIAMPSVSNFCRSFATDGYLLIEGSGKGQKYQKAPAAKVRILED